MTGPLLRKQGSKVWLPALLVGLVASASSAAAQQTHLGKTWMPKLTCTGHNGDQTVSLDQMWIPLLVTQERSDEVWVTPCWIAKDQLVSGEEAIDFYTQVLQAEPENARAYCYRGMTKAVQAKQDLTGALADLTAAIERDPKLAAAWAFRGHVLGSMQHDLPAALPDLQQATNLDPEHAFHWYLSASARFANGDIQGALHDCEKSLLLVQEHPAALMLLAQCLEATQEYVPAVRIYTRVLKLVPNHYAALKARGIAFLRSGQLAESLSDLTLGVRINQTDAELYVCRAEVLLAQQRLDIALEDVDRALRLLPENAEALCVRAKILHGQGNSAAAMQDIEHWLKLKPDDAAAYNFRGYGHYLLGDSARAILDLNRALELDPNYADAFHNRARAYRGQGKVAEALRDQEAAVKLNGRDSDYALALAGDLYSTGDLDRALNICNSVLALSPANVAAFVLRAKIHLRRDELDAAREVIEEARLLKPQDSQCNLVYYQILGRMGRWDEVVDAFQRAAAAGPNNVSWQLIYYLALSWSGRQDQAEQLIKDLIDRFPEDSMLRAVHAIHLIDDNQTKTAQTHLAKAILQDGSATHTRSAQARLLMHQGKRREAFAILGELVKVAPNDFLVNLLRGLIRESYGQSAEALKSYSKAGDEVQYYPDPYRWRAESYLTLTNYEQACKDWQRLIVMLPKDPRAYCKLALVSAAAPAESKVRDPKLALQRANEAYKLEEKKSYWTMEAIAAAYAAQGTWDKAVRWQTEALKRLAKADAYRSTAQKILAGYERQQPFPLNATSSPFAEPRRSMGALFTSTKSATATAEPAATSR